MDKRMYDHTCNDRLQAATLLFEKKKKKKLSKHDIQGAGGEAANHELRLYVLAQLFAFFPVDFLAKERLLAV